MRKLFSLFLAISILFSWLPAWAQVTRTGQPSVGVRVSLQGSGEVTRGQSPYQSSAVTRMQNFKEALILLDVTAVSGAASHTLDVCVQTTVNGTDFYDVGCFGQVTTSTTQRIIRWHSYPGSTVTGEEQVPVTGAAPPWGASGLAASTVRQGPVGDQWRVISTLVGSTAAYTYSVSGVFRE